MYGWLYSAVAATRANRSPHAIGRSSRHTPLHRDCNRPANARADLNGRKYRFPANVHPTTNQHPLTDDDALSHAADTRFTRICRRYYAFTQIGGCNFGG
jgi:hypothetical protein